LESTIARELHDAPMMVNNLWLDDFSTMGLELGEGHGFGGSHEATVSDHVGGHDHRKPPLDTIPCRGSAP
jgi:hypothetical protein